MTSMDAEWDAACAGHPETSAGNGCGFDETSTKYRCACGSCHVTVSHIYYRVICKFSAVTAWLGNLRYTSIFADFGCARRGNPATSGSPDCAQNCFSMFYFHYLEAA